MTAESIWNILYSKEVDERSLEKHENKEGEMIFLYFFNSSLMYLVLQNNQQRVGGDSCR